MTNEIRCDVCAHAFSLDDGQLGDICAMCGWETDGLEDCPAVAAWEIARGYCTGDEAAEALETCGCHLNTSRWRVCGFSAANHGTIRDARRTYAITLTRTAREEWLMRVALATYYRTMASLAALTASPR